MVRTALVPKTAEDRAAFAERQLRASRDELERFPAYVNIETINTCNARCVMCGIDFDKKPLLRIDDALFARILDELRRWNHHVRKVNLFFDCEPLMDRRLHERIHALKEAGIRCVTIATNGSVLNDKRACEIIEAGLDEIYISIDSLDAKTFEAIRLRLSFAQVYQNTLAFIRMRDEFGGRTRIRVQMVVQESNVEETQRFADHWQPLLSPGDLVVCHKAHNWGGAVKVMEFGDGATINTLPCTSLWSNAMIHVDGSVALCSVDTVQGSEHAIGHLRDGSIETIWRSEAMAAMRRRHLEGLREGHPLCDGCTAWRAEKNDIYIEIPRRAKATSP